MSEGVGAGKVVGIPQTEEDLEIVNGKKFSNAQRESMRAAAERHARAQKSAYSWSLVPLEWVSFDTCLVCAGMRKRRRSWQVLKSPHILGLFCPIVGLF